MTDEDSLKLVASQNTKFHTACYLVLNLPCEKNFVSIPLPCLSDKVDQ